MNDNFWQGGFTLLDGALGTMVQALDLPRSARPELLALTHPQALMDIHRAYVQAGSQVIYANTFGCNGKKLAGTGHTAAEVVSASVAAARAAAGERARVALDIGPLGELLEPLGSLTFERAYDLFREVVEAGVQAGADLIVIETMTDLYEAKAALLAAKEHSGLPVFVTLSFEEGGRTFTGCCVESMAKTLEGLGADAIGFNCSLGPDKMTALVETLAGATALPIIAKPNAGLPDPLDGHYPMGPEEFAAALAELVKRGATIVGGCCGTTPDYIALVRETLSGMPPVSRQVAPVSRVCTPTRCLELDGVRVIGERINPTGKKRLQQALREGDLDYILDLAVRQEDAGADILDVNVGCPGVDEVELLPKVVKKLQSAVSLPLQLDSADPAALEAALRVYNGKPAVNSVNGDPASLAAVLPLVKKYGGAVVGLCLDENGLPQTAEERLAIARRILDAALAQGIPREDVWIDCLTMTVSAQQSQAVETLAAVRGVREELGLQTVLGVSNISFGLPQRPLVNQTFLTAALADGLTLPILDPNRAEMMDAIHAFRVLSGEDEGCGAYVERFAQAAPAAPAPDSGAGEEFTLAQAILKGRRGEAGRLAQEALERMEPLALVEGELIPALDRAGEEYEAGRLYLPQLLSAAQAAQSVFEAVAAQMERTGGAPVKKGALAVATVRGDIHDIGKNIAKTVMENYGYQVLDLGRDVPPETVAEEAERQGLKLVGLSALMTTTLPAMAETVRLLKALPTPPAVFVAGAVVTEDYARSIGADYYAKDAKDSARIAREVLG